MPLARLPSRPSAVDACENSIRTLIISGEVPPGSRLPAERELAATLGVNRATLRSAMARLEAASLVEIRQGRGTMVLDFRTHGGPSLIPALIDLADRDLPRIASDLLLVRRQLARAVLQRICEGDAPLDGVDAAVGTFASAVATGDPQAIAQADLGVVASLLAVSASPILQLCLNPILDVLSALPALRIAIYAEPELNLAGWCAMLELLRSHPNEEALELLIGHLKEHDAATMRRLARDIGGCG